MPQVHEEISGGEMTNRILLTGTIVRGGEIMWNIPPMPPVEDEPTIGDLQDIIDQANADADVEEWQDYFLDQEFNRGGC